ncbi:very long chain fatty acid elongase 3 isoform X1 [Ascaphus truei]|uniref:very long chain fatty acid elongase 3 isoform X1 n=1 Tax=Ascaphus truei TaxID=8439 RepID=UPI003F591CB3
MATRAQEYDFERRFDDQGAIQWMRENWNKSIFFSLLYAALIFGGQHVMKERRRFELRKPLVLWSLTLAVFSIIGAIRTSWYLGNILSARGFQQSVCDRGFYNGPVTKFWAYAFVLSKVPELGDTLFIVLRKQRLIFLHWYHHITVLLYTWYTYKDTVAGGGWFMTMNFTVHSFMYSYYTLRAAGIHLPRLCAMFITITQILQMVMGTLVNVLVYNWMQDGTCLSTMENIMWSSLMYTSYLVLFCSFFYKAYFTGPAKTKGD